MTSTESNTIYEAVIEIKNATLKDMQCSYGYELLAGKTKGDTLNRNGIHIIHDELQDAFSKMTIFIAHIDGVFSHWANNQTSLEELESREELEKYTISSFKITGSEENKAVILSGSKETPYGSIAITTPKIKFNGAYVYLDELRDRLDESVSEVEAYMNGKTAPQFEQEAIEFDASDDTDFENNKV